MEAIDFSKMLAPVYTAVLSITFLEIVIMLLPRVAQTSLKQLWY
jgi:hypothetical protein